MGIFREKFKTLKNVFDLFTERNLFKLISQGYFEGLESPISIGKEANIFTAKIKEGEKRIVKIYRLSTCDFMQMYSYLRSDPRIKKINRNRRQIIFTWAQREYRNLLKARAAGVRVPTPFSCLYNILVLEFIGDDDPAPQLKDKIPENPFQFYNELVEEMQKLYKAGLVHADLSKFNVLNFQEHPVLIDFSQATSLDNPRAIEYLKRDVHNIVTFFKKLNIYEDEEKLLKSIQTFKKKSF
ncbi:serine protein kinase RIO [Candidatus Woesearchaeota archaeon]|nr:serine protein kinase RIO [Candidatus Woesearchaeota archaeon]